MRDELHLRLVSQSTERKLDIKNLLDAIGSEPPGTFIDLIAFNERHFGAADITGESPVWEMHPDTDEFFYIAEGEFQMTLLLEDGAETVTAPAGSVFVVPRTIWHKPAAPRGARFFYYTPGQTLHSDAEDPR